MTRCEGQAHSISGQRIGFVMYSSMPACTHSSRSPLHGIGSHGDNRDAVTSPDAARSRESVQWPAVHPFPASGRPSESDRILRWKMPRPLPNPLFVIVSECPHFRRTPKAKLLIGNAVLGQQNLQWTARIGASRHWHRLSIRGPRMTAVNVASNSDDLIGLIKCVAAPSSRHRAMSPCPAPELSIMMTVL